MDVFKLRKSLVDDYSSYVESFIEIRDERIGETVRKEFDEGLLWPEPLVQLNPAFESGGTVDELVRDGVLHPLCGKIFRAGKSETDAKGRAMRLYRHQTDAVRAAQTGSSYVLTTGTGSGKSLSYIIPIVDDILRNRETEGKGIKAVVVYPMNALANSQELELEKFLRYGPWTNPPVTWRRYTGQEDKAARDEIVADPPDIILTNYVMLELILIRPFENALVEAMGKALKFVVFDELHTYRGRQGADVAMLIRRLRAAVSPEGSERPLQCIGTSATLAGPGSAAEQKAEVARVASRLFGTEVRPDCVIMETLKSDTTCPVPADAGNPEFVRMLKEDVLNPPAASEYEDFLRRPLAAWIEGVLGLERNDEGRLVRRMPRPVEGKNGLAGELAVLTGIAEDACLKALKETLLQGCRARSRETGRPAFAFKLHQFISKGDTVYATAEAPETRVITLHGQQFAPDRDGERAVLFPLLFCRECGREYYSVWEAAGEDGGTVYRPRSAGRTEEAEEGTKGYLVVQEEDAEDAWPEDLEEQIQRLPEDWVEKRADDRLKLKKGFAARMPRRVFVRKDGTAVLEAGPDAVPAWFVPAPFSCCFRCFTSYEPRTGEFSKLASLGSEGRSTAATILSMSMVSHLRLEEDLEEKARKFLCFSDNRQDASLQAGHFNDFVEVGLIRSALFNAVEKAGEKGLEHDALPGAVFDALGLGFKDGTFPPDRYSVSPGARYTLAQTIKQDFLNVLSYRLYSDLRRGWRVVSPNLEQCGLLRIEYKDVDAICEDEELWAGRGPLEDCGPDVRREIVLALLDFLRRRLAIGVEVLDIDRQPRLKLQSSQHLVDPWALDEEEILLHSSIAFLRSKRPKEFQGDVFITPPGAFAKFMRRKLASAERPLRRDDMGPILEDLFGVLCSCGLLTKASRNRDSGEGFRIPAAAMIWKAGDGTDARHDQFRVHQAAGRKGRTNSFFVKLYR